jgi:small nuclear ribonucleoprotein (snRNP)-like protein
VRLRWTGTLACLDGYMNIAMEQTEARPARAKNGSAARPSARVSLC